ncbi:PAS domain-containing protein [Zavarzinia compransoris]|uniref:Chemotaxis protein n=1 Tax=Zavarzinia compransoris TaxID=1264899 RepID=A0A317E6R4_9PROT|nr:PAS domain-containing protein [Zavarzinia compransoris]PWR21960.1 chemotaxis protein [Zavarzinia compransoris]TDP47302.1 PAS domain S-box-containing protein [Zavarzinia compransoris]
MSRPTVQPTDREVFFASDEVIVSKTDLKGIITYANDVFLDIAGYTEAEVLGQPHNLIRHPEMPRCVFWLLWNEVQAGREIFAYVKNMTKAGDFYWVLAHVTPSRDAGGRIVGYHSNRRTPERPAVDAVGRLYQDLLNTERRAASPKDGLAAGIAALNRHLEHAGIGYDEFVFSL